MNEINDGGPAFPREYVNGMSLRDYFADSAMQSIITNWSSNSLADKAMQKKVAKISYELADAMIKESEKESN